MPVDGGPVSTWNEREGDGDETRRSESVACAVSDVRAVGHAGERDRPGAAAGAVVVVPSTVLPSQTAIESFASAVPDTVTDGLVSSASAAGTVIAGVPAAASCRL